MQLNMAFNNFPCQDRLHSAWILLFFFILQMNYDAN